MKQIKLYICILVILPGCLLSVGSVYPFLKGKSQCKALNGEWKFVGVNLSSSLNIRTKWNLGTKLNINTDFNMDVGRDNLIPIKENLKVSFDNSEIIVTGEKYTSYFLGAYHQTDNDVFVNLLPVKNIYGRKSSSKIVIDEYEYLGKTGKTQINTMGDAFCAKMNVVVWITIEDKMFILRTIEAQRIKEMIAKKKIDIAYQEIQGRILFTESTDRLLQIIVEHKEDIFSKNIHYKFSKVETEK